MKEKLRVILGKLSEKLGPILAKLFPEKSAEQIQRKRARKQRAIRRVRNIVVILLVVLGIGIGGVSYYFSKNDPDQYRAWLLSQIDRIVKSEESSVDRISWGFSIKDLSLGLKISGLKIRGAGTVVYAEIPRIQAYISFAKLFFGAKPIEITVQDPRLEMQKTAAVPTAEDLKNVDLTQQLSRMPEWVRRSLSRNGGTQLIVRGGSVSWTSNQPDEKLGEKDGSEARLSKLNAKAEFSGFPGTISLNMDAEVSVLDPASKLTVIGPVRSHAKGRTQGDGKSVFFLKIDEGSISLDEVSFSYQDLFEKGPKNSLNLEFQGNIQFKDTIFFSPLASIDLSSGKLNYPPLITEFTLKNEAGSPEYRLTWNLPKIARTEMRLPIRGLRAVSADGVLDSQGEVVIDSRPGSSRGRWRLGLNNLHIGMGDLGRELEIENASGRFSISSIFEGELREGQLSAERSELHLDGTEAGFTLGSGEFTKPRGDLLNISFAYNVGKGSVQFTEIKGRMNTLDLDAKGVWENYAALWTPKFAKNGKLSLSFRSNRVNLSDWSSYLQSFRSVPLQGFVETSGGFVLPLQYETEVGQDLEWRFDRLNLSNIRGSVDDFGISKRQNLGGQNRRISGPFAANVIFLGRGRGFLAERAKLISNIDLKDAVISFAEGIRKPVGVPAEISVSLEQMRNRATIQSARILLNDFEVSMQGDLVRGAPQSRVRATTRRPLDFSKWQNFYISESLGGRIRTGVLDWQGTLLLPARLNMEENFDWRDVALQGGLSLKNLQFEGKQFAAPFYISEAKAILGDREIELPIFNFNYQGRAGSFSGTLSPSERVAQQMTIQEILNSVGWEARGSLSAARLDLSELLKEKAQPEFNPTGTLNIFALPMIIPSDWFKSEAFLKSRVDLKLAVDEFVGAGDPLKKIIATVDWNGRSLRFQRFSALLNGGSVVGSYLSDFSNFIDREELPAHSATLELRKMDWPSMKKLFGGQRPALFSSGLYSGKITITADGFEGVEWIKSMKARLEGVIENSSADFMGGISESLNRSLMSGEIRDYAVKDFTKSACAVDAGQVEMDAIASSGELRFDRLKISSRAQRIELSGVHLENGELNLSGRFFPNTGCLRGDLRSCIKQIKGSDYILVKAAGPSSAPSLQLVGLPRAEELRRCIQDLVNARIQDEMMKEAAAASPKKKI